MFVIFLRAYLQLVKVVKLHGRAKIQQHVGQIWAFSSKFVQNRVRD